jgi:hypothetical protein
LLDPAVQDPTLPPILGQPDGSLRILANVAVEGTTSGGYGFRSAVFSFPITLCSECLNRFETCQGAELPSVNVGDACSLPNQDDRVLVCP